MSHLFTDQSLCLFPLSCSLLYPFRHTDQHGDRHSFPFRYVFPITGLARHSFRWEIRRWLSLCYSFPPVIYLLLSMSIEVWRAASLTYGSSNRERWSRLNSVPLKRNSKRRDMIGIYKIVNVMEKVSLSTRGARTSNGFRVNWRGVIFSNRIVTV